LSRDFKAAQNEVDNRNFEIIVLNFGEMNQLIQALAAKNYEKFIEFYFNRSLLVCDEVDDFHKLVNQNNVTVTETIKIGNFVDKKQIKKMIGEIVDLIKNKNGGSSGNNGKLFESCLEKYDVRELGKSFGVHGEEKSKNKCAPKNGVVNLDSFLTIRPLLNSQIICDSNLQDFLQILCFTLKYYVDNFADKFKKVTGAMRDKLSQQYFENIESLMIFLKRKNKFR
jgi:hypothetical protein